jgi:transposase
MSYKVFCGLDVGKAEHHATALDPSGKRVYDKAIANDEAALRALFTQLGEAAGLVVVVDQPASIGALPVAVAQAMGIAVEYLPGLSMRRIADLHPGNAKTDARDAYIIADAARTMPHALRSVDIAGPAMADLSVLVGHDNDLKDQVTAQTNRVRNLLPQRAPAAGTGLGPESGPPRGTGPAGQILPARSGCARLARPPSTRCGRRRRQGFMPASPWRCGPPWPRKPSPSRAPPRWRRSCPGWLPASPP